ncbi:MAG: hypothetical protein WCW04_02005 [Candidatus Paceibacterota bacterium]
MSDFKIIMSVVVVALTFIGYAPYIRDVIKNKTTPHSFTWLVWSFATGITFALQISGGAGLGALATLSATIICFSIFILGVIKKNKDIVYLDFVFLGFSFVALFLWVVVKQPVFSIILIVLVDVLGFLPTVRKSWKNPHSETLFSYKLNVIRQILTIFALQQYSILTWLSPAVWAIVNLLFSIMLIIRRKIIKNN